MIPSKILSNRVGNERKKMLKITLGVRKTMIIRVMMIVI